jgi:membrane protease YdiL (CAAX protease family)
MSGTPPPPPPRVAAARAVWLLTALRLKRLANQLTGSYNLGNSRRAAPVARRATPGKGRNRWLVSALVAVFMLIGYGSLTFSSIRNLHRELDADGPMHGMIPAGVVSEPLLRGLSMILSLLVVVAITSALAARELAQPDWDLEWLVTLPLRLRPLLWSRLSERAIANPTGILTLWPACTLIAWISGFHWTAPFVAALVVLPLLLTTAVARTLVDTGLRKSLPPSRLRNLQAVLSIASVVLLYVVISLGTRSPLHFLLQWAREFPAWATWLPPGLALRVLNEGDGLLKLQAAALLILEVALVVAIGLVVLERQLRDGVVATSSRETGRRVRPGQPIAPSGAAVGPDRVGGLRWLASAVQRRELTLLGRDRSFLVQTLVLPLVVVFSQVIFQGRLHDATVATISYATIAALAFGIAAYTLMMSAFQTLNSEGGSLWLLYTVPRSLESVLAEKVKLWACIGLAYPAAVFLIAILLKRDFAPELFGLAGIVLLGVPIYAAIAVALGVFGCDPLAQEVRARLRPTYVYLYLMLAGLYTYALYASEWSQRIVLVVLSGLLALALWQRARDELPYLLDPAASPPPRVSTSDGIIAAMLFFVVQGIIVGLDFAARGAVGGASITIAYTAAGAVAYLLIRYTYWRVKTQSVPQVYGAHWVRALGWGLLAGAVAALAGAAYLSTLRRFSIAPEAMRSSATALRAGLWIPLLAVVAAPLFEEFIFRGLIFGGLRRSLGFVPSAAASAAVFAIVHPPISMLPVFALGLCAAFAYQRARLLLAPMLAHAIYNATVIVYGIWLDAN